MSVIINIPTPCQEDWNAMTPNAKGRHCDSCAKTVIDFTNWQTHDIVTKLQTTPNVCGRFIDTQLNVPIPTSESFVKQIAYFKISTLKKAAAIFLFVFMIAGSSCNENTKGKALVHPLDSSIRNTYVGESVALNIKDTAHVISQNNEEIIKVPPSPKLPRPVIMGDIQMVPIINVVIDSTPISSKLMGEPTFCDTSKIEMHTIENTETVGVDSTKNK
jgi:hypothetical protein